MEPRTLRSSWGGRLLVSVLVAASLLPALRGVGDRAARLGVAGALAMAIFALATASELYRRR